MEINVKNYNKLNNSFKKKLVFRIGDAAGFFSEYNNMILTMLYCLKNQLKFVLSSKNANFSFNKGWNDYFKPFVKENNSKWIIKYNHRPYNITKVHLPRPIRILKRLNLYKLKHEDRFYWTSVIGISSRVLFTQDIFDLVREMNNSEFFSFPSIGIQGDLRKASRQLIALTWRYNVTTQKVIDDTIKQLGLPPHYIGIHIRGGDKILEHPLIDTKKYIEMSMKISNLNSFFVLTDDYSIILKIKSQFPMWSFYTLCRKDENGYIKNEFMQQEKKQIRQEHIKLFASIEILSKADHFIGTYSSNPGMYLGMRLPEEKCHGVDFDEWKVW